MKYIVFGFYKTRAWMHDLYSDLHKLKYSLINMKIFKFLKLMCI